MGSSPTGHPTKKSAVALQRRIFLFGGVSSGLEQGGGAKRRNQSPSGALISPRVPIFRNVYRGDYCPVGEYDFKCPPLCSGHLQRNNYFNFAFGATAFAERSVAMKAPVGLLSGKAVCVSRWRGFAPTSSAERSKRIFTGRGVTANRQLTRSATVSERNKRCKCHFPLRPLCENATPGRPQSARRCSIL